VRHLDWRDAVLLAALLPLWLATLALSIREGLDNGHAIFPFSASSAASEAEYPYVLRVWRTPPKGFVLPPLEPGDRILSVDGTDMRGKTAVEGMSEVYGGGLKPVVFGVERGGEIRAVSVVPTPRIVRWWSILPSLLGLPFVATFLLLRAPHWPMRRLFFVGSICWCLFGTWFFMAGGWLAVVNDFLSDVSIAIAVGLTVHCAWTWPEAAPPLRPWQRALPWLLGSAMGGLGAYLSRHPSPPGGVLLDVHNGLLAVIMVGVVGALVWSARYASALERRQGKWILFGFFVAIVPHAAVLLADALGVRVHEVADLMVVTRLLLVAIPLGFLIAITASGFLDIDRLLSASATYTLLAIALVGGLLALMPILSGSLSSATGLSAGPSHAIVAFGLAAVTVPLYRVLHPRIEGVLFAERQALDRGFHALLEELDTLSGLEDLAKRAGETIDELMRPTSIAAYARSGDAFVPIYARGPAVPPAFAADSPLASALARRRAPLAATRWARGAEAATDPFDLAALQTLSVAVVIPVIRADALVAFLCLGAKRSGDVYTNGELALLGGVAEKVADALRRLDDTQLILEAQRLQEGLRQYVPGAVARGLAEGAGPERGEREVSVLFVDVRGYTALAAGKDPDEIFSAINRYTSEVSAIVDQHGGAVVEFHGDGLMAAFGALEAHPAKERAAVEAAREIAAAVPRLTGLGGSLTVGVGVATGSAYVGDIRSADRRIWSVIGNTTNLAARLQALTRDLAVAVAIDPVTRGSAGDVAEDFECHEGIALRGRSERLDVWTLGVGETLGQGG
jgi:class 3 adenylate cyclase